jgi:hypothetical protein
VSKARSSVAAALVAAMVSSLTVMAPQAAAAATAQLSSDLDEHAWHFNSMPLADVHDAGVDGSGVVVAIIDDAMDTTHPDLAGKVTSSWRAFPDRIASPVPMPLPGDRFHGTHVGGIVAALDNGSGTTGVAPGATLLSYDVFHPATAEWDITQFSEALARAIVHAGSRSDVINMSLGGPDFAFSAGDRQLVCDAIGDATTAGALVVVAAGNDGEGPFFFNPLSIPAGCEQALAVASLDSDLNASKFTSFGEHLTVSAPGADILAPVPATTLTEFFGLDETNAVVSLSGTSMASPLVAGVAALIIDQDPTLTPAQVRDRITTTALDLGAAGPDSLYGAGVVDPAAALSLALPSPSAALHPTVLSAGLDFADETKLRVAWRPANGGPAVTGIDVVFWTASGVVTESLPGNRVSVVVDPPADAGWVHVVAHTASGSYTSSLAPFTTTGGGSEPDPFEFSIEDTSWTADGELTVNWTSVEPIPAGSTLEAFVSSQPGQPPLTFIDILLDLTLPTGARSGSFAIDVADEMMAIGSFNGPLFEPSQRAAVAQFASGLDWTISYYLQTDPDGFGGTADGLIAVDARHPLAAWGVAAGQREAEVTIIVPSSRWSQICEVDPCPGTRIDVVASGETMSGRLTPFFRSTLQLPRPWGARTLPAEVTIQRLVEDFEALIPVIESSAVGTTDEDVASDVPGDHPFASDIGWLYAQGLTSGCSGDAFCPDDTVTRGQMTAFLRRAFAAQAGTGTAASFTDVGNSVFAGDIAWASAAGVTAGCAPGRFCPDDPVTRGQMAAFLRRLLGDDISPSRTPAIFDDTVNSVFGDDIAWLSATGITTGCTSNRFCPNDSITRGQMAAFVRRAHTAIDR